MENLIKIPVALMRGEQPSASLSPSSWIAGGSVRRWFVGEKQDSDVDVFSSSDEAEAESIRLSCGVAQPASDTESQRTYVVGGKKIQFIKKRFKDVAECLDCFDFKLCQFAYDGADVWATAEAIVTTLRKTLAVHKLQQGYEVDSLRRAFKYAKIGYAPCGGTIRELAAGIGASDLSAQLGRMSQRWD